MIFLSEQELSEIMSKLGFMVLTDHQEEIYVLETFYCFWVVEGKYAEQLDKRVYEFAKYTFDKKKTETRLIKCYFTDFIEGVMIKRVGGFIAFMLENGHLKTDNKKVLPFAQECSRRNVFIEKINS